MSCNQKKGRNSSSSGQFVSLFFFHGLQLHSPLQHAHVQINLSLAGRWATETTAHNPNKQIKMWTFAKWGADGVRRQNSLLINRNWFCCTPLFSTGSLDQSSSVCCSQLDKPKMKNKKIKKLGMVSTQAVLLRINPVVCHIHCDSSKSPPFTSINKHMDINFFYHKCSTFWSVHIADTVVISTFFSGGNEQIQFTPVIVSLWCYWRTTPESASKMCSDIRQQIIHLLRW